MYNFVSLIGQSRKKKEFSFLNYYTRTFVSYFYLLALIMQTLDEHSSDYAVHFMNAEIIKL